MLGPPTSIATPCGRLRERFRLVTRACLLGSCLLLAVPAIAQAPTAPAARAEDPNTPNGIAGVLNGFLKDIDTSYFAYFAALAALGTLTMSIVEAGKTLFGLRRVFHRRWVRVWLEPRANRAGTTVDRVERELVCLASDGNAKALYACDIETLIRQLGQAAQVAVDNPETYPVLFEIMTFNASGDAARDSSRDDGPALEKDQIDLDGDRERRRLRQIVNAAVVAFHVSTAYDWQNAIRIVAFAVSAVIAFTAIAASGGVRSPGAILVSALLGAFLAPVAHDLVAALQRMRS
jgi:hypothetical protein